MSENNSKASNKYSSCWQTRKAKSRPYCLGNGKRLTADTKWRENGDHVRGYFIWLFRVFLLTTLRGKFHNVTCVSALYSKLQEKFPHVTRGGGGRYCSLDEKQQPSCGLDNLHVDKNSDQTLPGPFESFFTFFFCKQSKIYWMWTNPEQNWTEWNYLYWTQSNSVRGLS